MSSQPLRESPPTQLVRDGSNFGAWEIATRAPHPRVGAIMLGYFGLKSVIDLARERHLPSGEVALLVNFGAPYRVMHPGATGWRTHRTAAVIGVHAAHVITEETGVQHVLMVRLKPFGAHILFDVPMHELANRFVELDDVDSQLSRSLPSRLHEAADWETRFSLVDSIIASRMDRFRARASRAAWAWQKLRESDGLLSIKSLAVDSGCSQKHLIAQFRDYVGVPPKVVARVIRFNRAVKSIELGRGFDGARIAMDCGYYDQAHFIRDFRNFAGCTPGELSHSIAGPSFRADDNSTPR